MTIYCVIVTFNGIKWIKKSLDSIFSSSIRIEVICIDNGSTDNTQNIIKSYSSVKFIQSETNLGFGKANNIGINIALENNADFVFLLNQDAWIEKNTLKKLITYIPGNKAEALIKKLHGVGGGKIGNYEDCSFKIDGIGTYKGNEISNPYIGKKSKKAFAIQLDTKKKNKVLKNYLHLNGRG